MRYFVPSPPASPRGKSGLLASAATLLYGDKYIKALATLVQYDRRTIRRWLSEDSPIPVEAWNKVYTELDRLRVKVNNMQARVTPHAEEEVK